MLALVKHIQRLRYESLKAWMFGKILSQKKIFVKILINNPNCLPDRNSATQKKINLSKRQIRTISPFLPLGFRTKQPFHHFMAKATLICSLDIIFLYHFNYSQPIFSPDSFSHPTQFQPWGSVGIVRSSNGEQHFPLSGKPQLPPTLPKEKAQRRPDPRSVPISYKDCTSKERESWLSVCPGWLKDHHHSAKSDENKCLNL